MKRSTGLITLCFLICVNYHILRNLKDSLILTQAFSGAEAIPFLKTWVLIPGTLLLVSITLWLSNRLRFSTLFFSASGFFISFYILYTFVLYPHGDLIHLHALADHIQNLVPSGWKGFVAIIRYWPDSLFYVMAESWAVILWYILFTGFANEVMNTQEAKVTYPWIILAGNVSAVFAGFMVNFLTNPNWISTLNRLTLFMGLVTAIICLIFKMMHEKAPKSLSSPYKMSFWESLKELISSKYLLCLALVVFGFNMIINMTEVIWKDQVLKAYPHPSDYNAYMNQITILIGLVSAVITLFLVRVCANRFHWTVCAVMTPLVTIGSALIFFCPLMLSLVPLGVLVFLGSMHIIFSRSTRYTLFDLSKELALIPLPSDQKFKAKSHIDGIGSRLGKASSSGLFQLFLLVLPNITACAPFVLFILLGVTGMSLLAIRYMGAKNTSSHQLKLLKSPPDFLTENGHSLYTQR